VKNTSNPIFGYPWEEIQARQQGTYRPKPIVFSPLPAATDEDRALLAQYGSIEALKVAGLFGVVDRLSREVSA
jgi:hypothetical protein